jgi:lysyl endopeptidase
MIYRLFHTAVCILSFLTGIGQISKEGNPLSWNPGVSFLLTAPGEVLEPLAVSALIQEDNAVIGQKASPYRFASAQYVDYSTAHNGEWRNLANGDRIWLLGIECVNALALSVTFSHLSIPPGGTVYLYNHDRTDFAGPLTHDESRPHAAFGTAPIGGSRLIIEYYEPFAHRGKGEIVIRSVARSYRAVNAVPVFPGNDCASSWSSQGPLGYLSDAVLLILTDEGQRAVTGTLVNNTRHDGEPFVVTANSAIGEDPSALVFVQGVSQGCGSGEICWDRFVSGADVLREDELSGLALLRLRGAPSKSWNSFVAGWNLREPEEDLYTCLQHAYASPQTVAQFRGYPEESSWDGFNTIQVAEWDRGNTFTGSLGSPLFNSKGEMVGVLTGGTNTCGQSEGDHFGSLSRAWSSFRDFLDPVADNLSALPGFYPMLNPDAGKTAAEGGLIVFPNPVRDRLSVHNETDEPILCMELHDGAGRLCVSQAPLIPALDVANLPAGCYILSVHQPSRTTRHRVIVR